MKLVLFEKKTEDFASNKIILDDKENKEPPLKSDSKSTNVMYERNV